MSISFIGNSLLPKKDNIHLKASVRYTINAITGAVNLLLQNNTMVTAKPQSRMEANVTVNVMLNENLKKNQLKHYHDFPTYIVVSQQKH